jgi:DsbC/DsbD-like thiol-disulfide interchange protein
MALNSFSRTRRPKAVLFLTGLLSISLLAQSSGHLSLGTLPKVTGKRGAAVQAKIPLVVDPGFHVNSNAPNEQYLIPLKITWKETGALEAGQIVYPKPVQEKYDFSEKPLSVFTGSFGVTANFKVAANAPAGPGVAAGTLRYQACNDKMCFPPKNIEISLPYSVQ